MRTKLLQLISAITLVVALGGFSGAAQAATPVTAGNVRQAAAAAAKLAPDRIADPGTVLAPGYRTSADRAVAVAGDATGLHVLVATAASGYAWRTVATLSVRGTDTTQWIGQACVTGSGKRAVVVYAPRQITNDPDALGYGALAAVVDLATGKVRQLGAGVSIAYFNPGCGTGQSAVLTQGGTGASPAPGPLTTRLLTVNTATGQFTHSVQVAGQVTSAVPYGAAVAAATSHGLASISTAGRVRMLDRTHGVPFRLAPDASGGLGFLVKTGKRVQVHRYSGGRDKLLGSAAAGAVELSQTGGRVFVTGSQASRLGALPSSWRALDVPAGSDVSSSGMLAISLASTGLYAKGKSPLASGPDAAQPVHITAQVSATKKHVSFVVPASSTTVGTVLPDKLPKFAGGGTSAPVRPRGGVKSPTVSPPPSNVNPATTTYDPDRSCSVPRNDPSVQTYQPSAAEIEWAADQAVQNHLTNTQPSNLYGSGLPAYSPQGLFPAPGLDGGGSVPAQVLLGILAQESNEDQASNHAIIGQTGNFMPSYNWYGDGGNYTYVDWADSDCGYGIAQVTSGMCLAGYSGCTSPMSYQDQLAVAVDFEANIASGLQILEQKWNQLYTLGITANGGSPQFVENWWFALWAYNSGLEPNAANGNTTGCSPSPSCTDAPGNGSGGNWGLGWVDNPANPMYPPDRPMFLAVGPAGSNYSYNWDTAHPGNWSYEEKVVGWGAFGFSAYNYVQATWAQAFATARYSVNGAAVAQPGIAEFCSLTAGTGNNCNPAAAGTSTACQLSNSHCWWHSPVTWTNCTANCGVQVLTYAAGAADPGDPGVPAGYAPACTSSPLPSGTIIVGDTASSIPAPLGCGTSWSNNGGTMTWSFGSSGSTYPSKIDFHQIGGGYSGHFWFTHSIPSKESDPGGAQLPQSGNADLAITGTWTPPSSVSGWTRIMAAIPNVGAWEPQANYQVNLGNGTTDYRPVNQAFQADSWVDLGIYKLAAGASVQLSNVTFSGSGDDIGWGAMAFVKTSAPGADYTAMGDSYSSGEGVEPYDLNSDYNYAGMVNACHRSTGAYSRLVKLPGQTKPIAQQALTLTSGSEYHFTACSGAVTTQLSRNAVDAPPTTYDNNGNTVWGTAQNLYDEIPQTEQGTLTSQTTLVTLSVGGNDARFSDVLTGCILSLTDCTSPSYYLTRNSNGVVDPQPLTTFEPTVIGLVQSHVQTVYEAIAQRAPNAEIIVVGYPDLFPSNPTTACPIGLGLTLPPDIQNWMNQMGQLLNQKIDAAVGNLAAEGFDIHFIDPNPGFAGHDVCAATPWINGLINWSSSGSGFKVIGTGSFHPTAAGQQEYATLIGECLAGTLSC